MNEGGSLARLALVAAMLAGCSYLWVVVSGLEGPFAIMWKGAGVGLLAAWCAIQARDTDGWLIAAVMAFAAAGDVLLETNGLMAGALAFAAGHLVAVGFYWRNRRETLTAPQRALALVVLAAVPLISWRLTGRGDIALYGLLLAAMAATAWTSRFPRYRVGIGAMLFVISDVLIFARMGPLAGAAWASFAIWALYFGGQFLIATGVVGSQRTALR
jgi:uncharacterized membrane protein YhhN